MKTQLGQVQSLEESQEAENDNSQIFTSNSAKCQGMLNET